jgi:organic radical activating enzyme
MSNKYPIYEHFYSWQGEGLHSGKSAYFLRSFGCPLKCEWCDSAGTWHPDWIPDKINRLEAGEIYDLIRKYDPSFVVITGGEPCVFDWSDLINYVKKFSNINFHLETSGAFEILGDFKWITVSPKKSKLPLIQNIEKADEIKLIVEDDSSIEWWLAKIPLIKEKKIVYLNPEWSKTKDQSVLNSITNFVKNNKNFRVGYQLHKLFKADNLDENSKQEIPLGGKK